MVPTANISYCQNVATRLKHGRLVATALTTVLLVCTISFGIFTVLLDEPFSSPKKAPASLTLSKVRSMGLPQSLHQSLHSSPTENHSAPIDREESRGIIMSCPVAGTKTHDGPWKPRNLARGAEAVVRQLIALNVSIPLFFAYYQHEQSAALPFCRLLAADVADALTVHCFLIPEPYPTGQYGYAKIFALMHVPVRHALWFDCDAFPIRDPSPLFTDPEYRKAGAMYVISFLYISSSFADILLKPLVSCHTTQN